MAGFYEEIPALAWVVAEPREQRHWDYRVDEGKGEEGSASLCSPRPLEPFFTFSMT